MIDLENVEKIKLEQLTRREYSGRICVAFDYRLYVDKDVFVDFTFHRMEDDDENIWYITAFLPPLGGDNVRRRAIDVMVALPVQDIGLVTVCAYGLNAVKYNLIDCIQSLQAIQFRIGAVTEGL